MSDSPLYEAMREFIRTQVAFEVLKAKGDLKDTLTREAPKELNIEDLERRVWERVVPKLPAPQTIMQPKDGQNGVGIAALSMRDGNLVVRFTNDVEQVVGRVIGEKGDKGDRGDDGEDGAASTVKGDKGDRGADGIATREELHSLIEERMGEIQVRTFADVYQGVYENGRAYTRGLLTTWGGSLWLSQAPETKSKPGESADWKLVVKKGADARK